MFRLRTDSMSSVASSEFSSGGSSSVTSSFSIRDCAAKIKALQQENFDLRLRIFILEEKLKEAQTLKLQMKADNNQRPVNYCRFFNFQNHQSYEEETERELISCRQSLQTCIELVIEATDTIVHVETEMEKKQREMENMEEKLVEAEAELSVQRLATFKEDEFLIGSCDDDAKRNSGLRSGTVRIFCDPSTQCEISSRQRNALELEKRVMQDSYVDSVIVYRKVIEKLEDKLMLAEEHWKSFTIKLASFLRKSYKNSQTDVNDFLNSLTSSKEIFCDIFNTNSIFESL